MHIMHYVVTCLHSSSSWEIVTQNQSDTKRNVLLNVTRRMSRLTEDKMALDDMSLSEKIFLEQHPGKVLDLMKEVSPS